jgi:hypothetical protein
MLNCATLRWSGDWLMKSERRLALLVIVAVFSLLGWHYGWFHRIVLISK